MYVQTFFNKKTKTQKIEIRIQSCCWVSLLKIDRPTSIDANWLERVQIVGQGRVRALIFGTRHGYGHIGQYGPILPAHNQLTTIYQHELTLQIVIKAIVQL